MEHILLVHNTTTDPAGYVRDRVVRFFTQAGLTVTQYPVLDKAPPELGLLTRSDTSPETSPKTSMVIVLGGDGTFLRTARLIAPYGLPLLGINTGRLGFLTRVEPNDQLEGALQQVLSGHYTLETLPFLVANGEGACNIHSAPLALNDVVIKSSHPGAMLRLEVSLRETPDSPETLLACYDADGLIVSTPTGSTAYALSAGGPVLVPGLAAMALVPISPHTLAAKPLVVPATVNLLIRCQQRQTPALVSVILDGDVHPLEAFITAPQNPLCISIAPATVALSVVHLSAPNGDNFYTLLRRKLNWAQNPRQ